MQAVPFTTADLFDSAPGRFRMCDLPFRHYGGVRRFTGPCVTLLASDSPATVAEVLAEPGEGRVLVVDGRALQAFACLGDRLGARALDNGWAGVIVAGAVRDTAILATLELGVMALRTTAMRSFGIGRGGARDTVLAMGGIEIRPGDIIYADEDAVLAGPPDDPGASLAMA